MKTFYLTLLAVCFSLDSFAVGQDRGGGFTVQKGNIFYLFDFYEAGIENTATIPSFNDEMGAKNILRKTDLPNDVMESISDKLNQIYKKVPDLAVLLLETVRSLEWNIVAPDVIDPDDTGWTPISEKGVTLIPTAVRSNEVRTVTIKRNILSLMPHSHKVGLVFHEAVRFLALQKQTWWNDTGFANRSFVALIFKKGFDLLSAEDLAEKYNSLVEKRSFLNAQDYAALLVQCPILQKAHTPLLQSALDSLSHIALEVEDALDNLFYTEGVKAVDIRFADESWSELSDDRGRYTSSNFVHSLQGFRKEFTDYQVFQGKKYLVPRAHRTYINSIVPIFFGESGKELIPLSTAEVQKILQSQESLRNLRDQYPENSYSKCLGLSTIELEEYVLSRSIVYNKTK